VSEIAKIKWKRRATIVRRIKSGKFGRIRKKGNKNQVPHQNFEKWWDENMRIFRERGSKK
jgi:hypothetical protein